MMTHASSPTLTLIAAQGRNRVIGADGAIPWRLKSDFAHFKAATLGRPVIMGRKTWESLPRRPLPGRLNIVVTRDPTYGPINGWVMASLDTAIEAACAHVLAGDGPQDVAIIGGADIYAQAMARATDLIITDVDAEPPGDALFPQIDPDVWALASETRHMPGPDDDHGFSIRYWRRRRNGVLPDASSIKGFH